MVRRIIVATLKQARRLIIAVVGFTLLVIGLTLLVLPGPAFLVIPAGLAVLATEFFWARRLLKRVTAMAHQATSRFGGTNWRSPSKPAPGREALVVHERPRNGGSDMKRFGQAVVLETDLKGIGHKRKGKVRDIYDLGDKLLLVATDRISAFDVVLPDGIPEKGTILTQLSLFWFSWLSEMGDLPAHHLISADVEGYPESCRRFGEVLAGRSMLVRKTDPLPVECIVRGYLSGSAWKEYRQQGAVCQQALPSGLQESDRLPEPIFTPSTKAQEGHDQNIPYETMEEMIGKTIAGKAREASLLIYRRAAAYAEARGIIIADTKFEFGMDPKTQELIVIDEILTPDSSRFWPKDGYSPGRPQPSFDKQFVRDYLDGAGWNRQPPAPRLPAEVIAKTTEKYREAHTRLTGR